SKLAEKFIIIWPIDGWPFGISGKSLEKKGPIIRDNTPTPPAFSAMLKKPIKRAIIPISGIIISITAFFAV
ncbi:MAG TPA: hypothetical protein VM935_00935, partial [Chitinophagaceae bacterium]|nr:hypothetical protein [Chitinophagaceae bacterium]